MSSQPHRAPSEVRWRRRALGLLVGLAAAAAIVVPSTLAAGKAPPAGKAPSAGQTTPQDNSCPGGAPSAITSAVAQLEHAGTIDQAQAQSIDAALYSECSFDLQQLIDSGIITAAQAQAVNDAITHAKMSLAAAGALAGTRVPGAKPRADTHRHAAAANGSATRTPTSPVPGKTHTPGAVVNHQPFLNAIQRLVDDGTITAGEGQAVDREILAGSFDPQTLTSSGFTQTQLKAVQEALRNAKRALARNLR